MKRKTDVLGIFVAIVAGTAAMCLIIIPGFALDFPLWLITLSGVAVGIAIYVIADKLLPWNREINFDLDNLPAFAGDYIKLVIQYMGYRRIARQEVADELTDHFEAALKDCPSEQERNKRAKEILEEL